MTGDDKNGKHETAALARTAEMLALPQLVCRRRDCRRSRRCRWFYKASGEPCCLANLDAGQRCLFDEAARYIARARRTSEWGALFPFDSAFRHTRILQDAAVEAAWPAAGAHPSRRRLYREFARANAKAPPSQFDD